MTSPWWNPPIKEHPHAKWWLHSISLGTISSTVCPWTDESFRLFDIERVDCHLASACPFNNETPPLVISPHFFEVMEAGNGGWGYVRKNIEKRIEASINE